MTTDLRYPVGPWARPSAPITAAQRAANLTDLRELPARLRAAIAALSDAQLDTPYRPGGWSVRQVVHHVADSHMNAFIRIKWALTESNPTIKPYDEVRWAELPDAKLPLDVSLRLIDAVHQKMSALLAALPDSAFATPYQHPESGPFTIDLACHQYAWHSRHHTAHITSLRVREGW